MTENPFEQKNESLIIAIENPTKADVSRIANQIITKIRDNDQDYLGFYIKAKACEEVIKSVLDEIKSDAKDEAEKLDKNQKYIGSTVSVKNLPDSYDFSDNESWIKLKEKEVQIKNEIKELEEKMKTAMKYAEIVDSDGVVIAPATIKSFGSTSLSVTLPK